MKKKIDDLRKAYKAEEKENEKRAAEIQALEAEKSDLDEKARLAAVAADQEKFNDFKRQAEFIGYRLEALKESLEAHKDITLPLEEVQEAWTTEEKARRAKLEARAIELENTIDKLKTILNDITELENDGLKNRNFCAELVGMKPATGGAFSIDREAANALQAAFPMKYYHNDIRNPEVVYFLQKENRLKRDNPTNNIYSQLFNTHSPLSERDLEYIKTK